MPTHMASTGWTSFISCQRGHTLRPLTTITKARHKRECPPSDSVPFTTKHRTNIPLSPQTNCSTPWERNPKVILVYLLSSLRSISRQLSLCALFLQTTLSVDLHLHYGTRFTLSDTRVLINNWSHNLCRRYDPKVRACHSTDDTEYRSP